VLSNSTTNTIDLNGPFGTLQIYIDTAGSNYFKNNPIIQSGGNALPFASGVNRTINDPQFFFGGLLDFNLNNGSPHFFFRDPGATRIGWIRIDTDANPPIIDAYAYTTDNNITAGQTGLLPVEFLTFYANANANQILINWETASESNNAGFEVQRSTDGREFQNLDFVEGKGTTVEHQKYSFEDKKLRKGQLYYYRLKQIHVRRILLTVENPRSIQRRKLHGL